MQRLFQRHVVQEPLVYVIKQLLCAICLVLLDFPEISLLVKIAFVAFDRHRTYGEIWNRFEAMLIEDSLHLGLVRIVDDSKEHRYAKVRVMLPVGVRSTNELIIDILALIAAHLDRKKVDHVVWPWVLNDKLTKIKKANGQIVTQEMKESIKYGVVFFTYSYSLAVN